MEKSEFALFYATFLFEEDRTVNEFYEAYDQDEDGNLSAEEFRELYCANVYNAENSINFDCSDEQEFDFDICKCVALESCERTCENPLILDPVTKCDCISLTEFTQLYDHTLDDQCRPKLGLNNKIVNNFNFYGSVYGDVSGFSTGHISNLNEPKALEKYAYWKKHSLWEEMIKDYEVGQLFEGLETLPFFL